jgi:predicted DNA-binding ribbon-helix-helix protein
MLAPVGRGPFAYSLGYAAQAYTPSRNEVRDGNLSSIRMEPVFFYALRLIAFSQGLSMADLIRNIEARPRYSTQSLASALRCYALREMMALYFAQIERAHQPRSQK